MVEKFYAYFEHDDGTGEILDVYEAIQLVHDPTKATIIVKPKEKCPLYDIETFLKVSPVRGKNPYFKYYRDETSPLVGRSSILEYTPELKTFIRAFEGIDNFKIEESDKEIITLFPKKMNKLKRIETSNSFVILKFLVNLRETKPYSYFYKYNGVLGLEFTVTSYPEPIKRKELGKKGIPLFCAELKFPEWIDVPEEISDEEEFEAIAAEIKNTYQNRNYRLQGEFINDAVNFPDYKEKYTILNDFERQCEELREEKRQYKELINQSKEQLSSLEIEKKNQQQLVNEARQLLDNYRNELAHFEKIKEDNEKLLLENDYLSKQKNELNQLVNKKNDELEKCEEETSQLKIVNAIAKNEENRINGLLSTANTRLEELENNCNRAEKQVKELENKGFFKKIFNKKSK